MQRRISPASAITGAITLPGDKSISHRYAMISAIADGESRIHNYSTGADCHSTLGCVRALGIEVEVAGTEVRIEGKGLDGLRAPAADLDAGNSGSTIRMLCGILAAQPFVHAHLRGRIAFAPADAAHHAAAGGDGRGDCGAGREVSAARNPGRRLRPIDYTLPVPSAQVKTCVLFAGLFAEGQTCVSEPVASRDHTEIALREFGAEIRSAQRRITLTGRPRLTGRELYGAERSLLGRVLHCGRAVGAGIAAHHPRRGAESHALGAARSAHGDGREDPHSRRWKAATAIPRRST